MGEKYDLEWYNSLSKPSFQPKASVFKPAWTVLYTLMLLALLLVIFSPFRGVSIVAYMLFLIQLIVNLSWPIVFFKQHDLLRSFFLCLLLTLLVFLTMVVFYFISKLSALLLLPYLLWCGFATILSFELWELNSD